MSNDTSKRVPKYRKHKRSGNALVVINGREIYLGKHGSAASIEKYNRLIAEWLQSERQSTSSQQEITVAEVMVAYIAFARGYYRKNGKATREFGLILDAFRALKPLYGRSRAADFGPLALKTVRQTLIDSGISREHINRQAGRIKHLFKWAAAEELISSGIPQALSIVVGLRRGRTEAKEMPPVQPVADADVEAALPYRSSTRATRDDISRDWHVPWRRLQSTCSVGWNTHVSWLGSRSVRAYPSKKETQPQ